MGKWTVAKTRGHPISYASIYRNRRRARRIVILHVCSNNNEDAVCYKRSRMDVAARKDANMKEDSRGGRGARLAKQKHRGWIKHHIPNKTATTTKNISPICKRVRGSRRFSFPPGFFLLCLLRPILDKAKMKKKNVLYPTLLKKFSTQQKSQFPPPPMLHRGNLHPSTGLIISRGARKS